MVRLDGWLRAEGTFLPSSVGNNRSENTVQEFLTLSFLEHWTVHRGTSGNHHFTGRGPGKPSRALALRDLGWGLVMRLHGASSFPSQRDRWALNVIWALSRAPGTQPGHMGVWPALRRFLFGSGLPETPGVWLGPAAGLQDGAEGAYGWPCSCHRRPRLSSLAQSWRCFRARGMRSAADRFAKSRERGNVAKAHGSWLPGEFLFCFLEPHKLRRCRPTQARLRRGLAH